MSEQRTRPNRLFAGVVIAATALGGTGGALVHGPQHPSEYALNSLLVYRIEVGLILFLALYISIVLVRLAYHGRTPSRIGAGGADLPDVSLIADALSEFEAAAAKLATLPPALADRVEELERRIAELEDKRGIEGIHAS
jgi:hypothetical protein